MRALRIAVLLAAPVYLHAEQDLGSASLEDLMNIQVTSASRKPQALSRVPKAMYVLTADDIRRSGATSLPEALRWVPGLDVAQIDSNKWAVSARGFNGRFSNKMLVLLDGRSLYSTDFSGVFWDLQDTPLEDLERIEIIRGPGATMWGSNAVNGVINIITKHSKETVGGSVQARAGNYERAGASARYGFGLGSRGHARVWGKHSARETLRPEGTTPLDSSWDTSRGGFRSDLDFGKPGRLMLQGDFFRADRGLNSVRPSFNPPYSLPAGRGGARGGMVLGRWSRSHEDLSQTSVQVYFQKDDHDDGVVYSRSHVIDAAMQRQQFFGRHDFQWGGNMRSSKADMGNTEIVRFLQPDFRNNLLSAFVQDEITLIEGTLSAVIGTEVENSSFTGTELQPAASIVWSPGARATLWGSVSTASRSPSMSDGNNEVYSAIFPSGPGALTQLAKVSNPEFGSEHIRSHEAGWRWEWHNSFSTEASVYYNVYSDLATYRLDPPVVRTDVRPVITLLKRQTVNGGSGDGYGFEIANRIQLSKTWRLVTGYSHLRLKLRTSTNDPVSIAELEGRSPQNRAFMQSQANLPRGIELDLSAARTGKLLYVPAYTRVDARIGWSMTESISLSLAGQNLIGPAHVEFDTRSEGVAARSRVGRTVYSQVAWRF